MTPVVAFVGNSGDAGTPSLVHHLAWTYADEGLNVLVADFDPQARLTAAFLDDAALEELWLGEAGQRTTHTAILDTIDAGEIGALSRTTSVNAHLFLLAGSPPGSELETILFETLVARGWAEADRRTRVERLLTAPWHLVRRAATDHDADVVLIDVGSGESTVSWAGLIAADHVVFSVTPDPRSVSSLRQVGSRLAEWRSIWTQQWGHPSTAKIVGGAMAAAGYVISMGPVRTRNEPSRANHWMRTIPSIYAEHVLHQPAPAKSAEDDPHCLHVIRDYRSLIPLAQEARKPLFHLTAADGALGSLGVAVHRARDDYRRLAASIAESTWRPNATPETTP